MSKREEGIEAGMPASDDIGGRVLGGGRKE